MKTPQKKSKIKNNVVLPHKVLYIFVTFFIFNSMYSEVLQEKKKLEGYELKLIDTIINKTNFSVYKSNEEIKVRWGNVATSTKFEDSDLLDTISKSNGTLMLYTKKIDSRAGFSVYKLDDNHALFALPLQDSRIALWGVKKEENTLIFYEDIYNQTAPMIFSTPNIVINITNGDVVIGTEISYEEYPNTSTYTFSNIYILTTYGTENFYLISYFRFNTSISVFESPIKFYNKLFNQSEISNPLYRRKDWTGE